MYIRTKLSSNPIGRERRLIVRSRTIPGYFRGSPFQPRLGLGQPPAANPACAGFLKDLRLFPHFHIQKSVSGGSFVRSAAPVQLALENMSLGFVDSTTGAVRVDPGLDSKLKKLVADMLASKPPFDKEPYKTFVASKAKIAVALVDVSSATKLVAPQLAEFKSTVETEAASLAKIGALYAAHQLKFDLNHKARTTPGALSAGDLDGLRAMFDITSSGGATPVLTFDFNSSFKDSLNKICHNCEASRVIGRLGTTYISSVLRQSGLYDCRLGGVWVGTLYAGPQEVRDACPDVAPFGARVRHMRDPLGNLFHGVTALSAASFFTLLAQGRLVEDAACQSMKDMLIFQKNDLCQSRFETGLNLAGLPVSNDKVFSKIGVLPTRAFCSAAKPCCGRLSGLGDDCTCRCFIHEAALIERVHGSKQLRYVASVLTESKPGAGANDLLIDIIAKLDELIRNNP